MLSARTKAPAPPEAPPPAIPNKRAIISRRKLSGELEELVAEHGTGDKLRPALLACLRRSLADGRVEVRRRFDAGGSGEQCVRENCYLADRLVGTLADFTVRHIFPTANPTAGEVFDVAATGGYGRGELAPFSDIDLLFLLPYKRTPRVEQVVEYMLYILWDLGLKVGHAVRSVDECIRQSKADVTIRTAILESRYLWGPGKLFAELRKRYDKEVVAGTGPEFVEAKLAERDNRHLKMGDSRYVLEPNLKDGKGGLRDLQTLFWIAKYLYRVENVDELVGKKVLTPEEAQRFAKAQNFLWTARCHLHYLAGRLEDRLTFDVQTSIGAAMGYTDHAGTKGVERFMKHYFLVAKDVGDLTRIFCAALEAESKRPPRFNLLRLASVARRKDVDGFIVDGERLNARSDKQFKEQPIDMIRLFHTAQINDIDIHPAALRAITRSLSAIGPKLRNDPEANRLFLDILTGPKDPEITLRRMNEAGVLARFIPDFGRVVAQMQYDMYHVYTVDEHTLFALGILHKIAAREHADELPLSTEVIHKVVSKRALYVAVLLHDIAKGRGGDHSVLGARVAEKLCPRLGLSAEETETVAWLVRWHLAMSHTAFKRDLEDDKTVRDFVALVQSPERLRLLLVLTVADIRAVGPQRWNNWKATLLRELYNRSEELMSGGMMVEGRNRRIQSAQAALRAELADFDDAAFEHHRALGYPAYWLAFDAETLAHQARIVRDAEREQRPLTVSTRVDRSRAVTEVTIYATDHSGLFSRLAGALAASGADIVDARIFTMTNGMALDVFSVQDAAGGGAFESGDKLAKLSVMIEKVLSGHLKPLKELATRRTSQASRTRVFHVPPRVLIDNNASTTHTVIEVNGRDRPGLLYDLTRALSNLTLQISSAKVSTFGEKAIDVFYVKDVFGLKVTHDGKLAKIRERLLHALDDPASEAPPPATVKRTRVKAGGA
ncbi:[protein-PII] uridylyltransferase [Azospirillum picis]|uniref:Bifunctional uridylyltransferase/uridylyl-removing enzyme n=1 Tax=Azospirillum picis TaxID=488438 RepID=A0ABU0MFZ0_9PROT|nr:[protein-PII] uridylyltransferase [Azospirillum picis]MBP2298642.1 [protein-PII] uridylyltransferase [Azospirillum picis]MDQ0532309.1 [protein-PII] uridylyltransferase [Azospirillum picis]